jgi:hypothetical protein
LKVAQVGGKGVEKTDGCELNDTVEGHVLEATKARYQCCPSLSMK